MTFCGIFKRCDSVFLEPTSSYTKYADVVDVQHTSKESKNLKFNVQSEEEQHIVRQKSPSKVTSESE